MMASLPLLQLPALTLPGSAAGVALQALCTALASLAPACSQASESESSSSLVVAEPMHDFGPVFEGRLLETEWEVQVKRALAVTEAKTDCGCTVVRLEQQGASGAQEYAFGAPLAAGALLHVQARYDTRGRPGVARRSVTLKTDAGELLPLTFATDVRPWLRTEPHDLAFTRVLEGVGAGVAFDVSSEEDRAFALRATGVALPPWVHLELAPGEPAADGRARRWSVAARLDATAPRGTFSYPLEVQSDVPVPGTEGAGEAGGTRFYAAAPNWTIQVVGPVALSTPNLEFGVVRPDETVARSLRLESFEPGFVPAGASAHLEPLHHGDAFPLGLTAQVHVRPDGAAVDIELVLAGLDRAVRGTFLAKLVVETGHPKLPELEALVRGVAAQDPAGAAR